VGQAAREGTRRGRTPLLAIAGLDPSDDREDDSQDRNGQQHEDPNEDEYQNHRNRHADEQGNTEVQGCLAVHIKFRILDLFHLPDNQWADETGDKH
jgi:hypothetical protein